MEEDHNGPPPREDDDKNNNNNKLSWYDRNISQPAKQTLMGKGNDFQKGIHSVLSVLPGYSVGEDVARIVDRKAKGKPTREGDFINLALDTVGTFIPGYGMIKSAFGGSGKVDKSHAAHAKMAEQQYKQVADIDQYKVIHHDPDDHFTIYDDGTTNYVAYRGTKLNDMNDIKYDMNIINGDYHKSERIKRIKDKLAKKLNRNKVVHVGHSLGGTTADVIATHRGDESVTFSKGTSPLLNYGSKKNTNYATTFDPVSIFDMNKKRVKTKKFNIHSSSNYTK